MRLWRLLHSESLFMLIGFTQPIASPVGRPLFTAHSEIARRRSNSPPHALRAYQMAAVCQTARAPLRGERQRGASAPLDTHDASSVPSAGGDEGNCFKSINISLFFELNVSTNIDNINSIFETRHH